ncbi:hypothetical protein BV20DRAFT_1033715 [Pilatotrama ljubarskyi]|nr:hypothetical protein BV20DRAFT_1033715 [Pilatotrama ljubarskyi]
MVTRVQEHQNLPGLIYKAPEVSHRITCAESLRIIPKISRGQELVFQKLWSLHCPVLVSSVDKQLQGNWSPQGLVSSYGHEQVVMFDSRLEQPRLVTAAEFFQEFMKDDAVRGSTIRLKDWPPSASFSDKFWQHYAAFMHAVPMPAYTRSNGFRNLAAHYPEGPVPQKPDLGPKMYVATRDTDGVGSTRLHLDVTSAVNILVYASGGKPTGALWHIFRPDDLEKLQEYLRLRTSTQQGAEISDPIHDQSVYLTPAMLEDLRILGVRPFAVQQQVGDAVFIPAGCAHQVSNTSACIKIACDFLCLDSVPWSARVSEQLSQVQHEDVLGLQSLLWHAWFSLSAKETTLASSSGAQRPTRVQRKHRKQREILRARDDQARRKAKKPADNGLTGQDGHISKTYKCPHDECAGATRTFRVLDGVFNHL